MNPTQIALALALGLAPAGALGAPQAPAQDPALEPSPNAKIPAAAWTQEVFTLKSKQLGEEIRVFVGKPPTFSQSQRKLPALYLLDGQYYFSKILSVLTALEADGQVPAMLLIGIESHDRRVDFTPPEIDLPDVGARARATTYLDFLEHELIPAAESKLRADKPRILMGHSHGAMLAIYAVSERPKVFPWVIALDPPVHHEHGFLGNALLRALARTDRPPVRAVSRKVVFGWSAEQWAQIQRAAKAKDLLRDGAMLGESHESMLFPASYQALQEIFLDSSALRTRDLTPLEIDELYRGLAECYGAEITPPEPAMRRIIEDFLLEGRGSHAATWLDRYVATYGKPNDLDELAARVKAAAALGDPNETVAGLLALPRATPTEMKNHLGTWKGANWRGDGRRSEMSVRFWVERDKVAGEIQLSEGPKLPLEYIRFRPDGALEFGFKNGMRPRGLIMYTEKEPGGPLEGEVVFRGMRFTPPPGEIIPSAHFELKREAGAEQK